MYTVAVLNQKGGVGKTTLATNLAAAAHVDGRRSLLVDMDVQGSAAEWYTARADASRLAGLVVVKMDRRLTVPKFRELASGYEFIVLDGPPRLDEVTCSAAVAADVVVIPVSPGPFDLWATSSTLATLDRADEIRAQLDRPPVRRAFVVNRAEVGTTLTRDTPEALAATGEVLDVVVHQRIVFKRAALAGESVLTFGGDDTAADEIRDLYKSIAAGRRRK
jgi:chromosome partitioning protein